MRCPDGKWTRDTARTVLGPDFCRGLITWIGDSPWRRLGIPAPQRGQNEVHSRYVFRGGMGLFFETSACPRFCKRRVPFCTQVRSMGAVKIPLQSTNYTRLCTRVTPKVTGLPSLLPPLAAPKQAEDYTNLRSYDTLYRWHLLGFGQTKIIYYILPDITRKIENKLIFIEYVPILIIPAY